MSAAGCLLSEDQLLCSICLHVFTLPVTLTCGHNFCKSCIAQYWDSNVQSDCPLCKERYDKRPKLRINHFIYEMATRFRQSAATASDNSNHGSNLEQQVAKAGDVCDESDQCGTPINHLISEMTARFTQSAPKTVSSFRDRDSSNLEQQVAEPGDVCDETDQHGAPINHVISEVGSPFRRSVPKRASSNSSNLEQQVAEPGDVCCSECTGAKLKALKSCLVCLSSYCETHLKPHQSVPGLRKHQLIDPVEDLEGRMCLKHDKPLELFCRTDHTSVCMLCTLLDHKAHLFVPLQEESALKKAMLGRTGGHMTQMIQERRLKIEEMKLLAKLNKEAAHQQMAAAAQVFTDLQQFLEGGLAELMDTMEEKLKMTDQQANGGIAELQQEISELMKRSAEVEQLSRSEDHFHLLQGFSAVNVAPSTRDWTKVSIRQPLYEQMVRTAVVGAVEKLQETFIREKKKLFEAELKMVQQYEVKVTLDPRTASPWLVLSDDGKQVSLGGSRKTLPNKPERFYPGGGVLAKQSFSSGRFYCEVRVKDKVKWDLGVVKESINRKVNLTKSQESGLWILSLRKGSEYRAHSGRDVLLSLTRHPQKVGVFVDYEEAVVSFYDADTADLIFSFTDCRFTEKLCPFFRPGQAGKNSCLMISAVGHTGSI